jgi:polynucleotide 5'-kinase involved in rRNA processing
MNSYVDLMKRGEPIEIIDGDNLEYYGEFKKRLFNHKDLSIKDKKLLVICICGPQNTGKSTFSNMAAGLRFLVADGRCTRGAYGSLLKLGKE